MKPQMQGISTKGTAATLGALISTVLWTILAAFNGSVKDLPTDQMAAVQGGTALVLGIILFYVIPESAVVVGSGEEPIDELLPPDEPIEPLTPPEETP